MENEPVNYTQQQEIDLAIDMLRGSGEWPGGDAQVATRAIMLQRRLALMAIGIKLPPITL